MGSHNKFLSSIFFSLLNFIVTALTIVYKSYFCCNSICTESWMTESEILLSDIKDYAIIPLGSLYNRRNAFINITNLIRSSFFWSWLIFILIHFSLIQSLAAILYSINTCFGFLDIQKFTS